MALNLFKSKETAQPDHERLLDQELYTVPGTKQAISWADSIEGTLITGATGSGKSSGPGKHIAYAMLKSGYGFCVLCAKPDEKERWVNYAKETGREDDLVIFNKSSDYQFNFLSYEMTRKGEGAGEPINAINTLMNLNEQAKVYQGGGGGKQDERFWENGLRRIISRTIMLLKLSGQELSISNMRRIVSECFRNDDGQFYQKLKRLITSTQAIDPAKQKEAKADLDKWLKTSLFLSVFDHLYDRSAFTSPESDERLVVDFWLKEFPKLSDRTASIITESFMGIAEPFLMGGILKEKFSKGLSPELLPETIIAERKIVIIDFPIKEFGLAGIYAATLYKSAFQAAMERRNIGSEENPKPIGLWIDEYQSFCNPASDSLFQATARSSWTACVYITQNINNIYFVMGDQQPEVRAKSLLGNLNLKIFASNADIETNQWASEMIGKHLIDLTNLTINHEEELSKTKNQQFQYRITPDHFTTLKTGRKKNNFTVEAVIFKAGKTWGKDGQNYAIAEFKQ